MSRFDLDGEGVTGMGLSMLCDVSLSVRGVLRRGRPLHVAVAARPRAMARFDLCSFVS
jgi:hypothetical protein